MLSVWHWVLALNLPAYPPVTSQLNIGCWIREDHDVSEHKKWIEVYACTLQHLPEASVGHSWTTEGAMTPEVTKLVDTFLAAVGMHVSLHIIREYWPMPPDDIPQQNLDSMRAVIMQCLDEVAMQQLSITAWDMFAFPEAEEDHWKEEYLSYYLSKVVNISARMPGLCLVIQDPVGLYSSCMDMLLYEGQMLIYDPASNNTEWVPMRGVSSSFMAVQSPAGPASDYCRDCTFGGSTSGGGHGNTLLKSFVDLSSTAMMDDDMPLIGTHSMWLEAGSYIR